MQNSFSYHRLVMLLIFMIVFGVTANLQSRHSGDDLSYLAYVTSWQHSQGLDFREVVYGTGTMDSIRFWLGMFPMSLTLLADISKLHGLLLVGFNLEPFLFTIALLAIYNLYEDLLSSQNQAIIALLLQFTFLFLLRHAFQPGFMFFERISEDKVFAVFLIGGLLRQPLASRCEVGVWFIRPSTCSYSSALCSVSGF